jgi:hypothetical protein
VQYGIPIGVLLPSTVFNPGHVGGQFEITLHFDANSLRLTTGNFDSGEVPYTTAGITAFNSLDDLGANVGIILGASAEANAEGNSSGDIISTVNFDRVLLDVSETGPTPQQRIIDLIGRVNNLAAAKLLKRPQANDLIETLNQAITNLDQGQVGGARNNLNDFINLVNDYITAGSLSLTVGKVLITDAIDIKTRLDC